MTDARRFEIVVALVNEDSEMRFSEWTEPVEDWLLKDDGTPDLGTIFRSARDDYGRCQSSVYVDTAAGGPPVKIGWYFVKRNNYNEEDRTYLQGSWVTVRELPLCSVDSDEEADDE